MNAAVGEDVLAAVRAFRAVGRQAHQREVRRTAANVRHQHKFFTADAGLVVERGGDGLVLEGDLVEAGVARDFRQRVFGELVSLGIFVDEEHRAAQHGAAEFMAGGALGAALEFADEMRQQLAEGHGLAHDLGAVVHHRRAEQALERAHQAALVAGKIVGQRGTAVADQRVFGVKEDDGRQRNLAVFERQQGGCVRAQPADGGVGRAEIDAASV